MKFPTFSKGVHPSDHKEYTNTKSIEFMPLPEEVFVPVQQHIGAPDDPVVERRDEVKTGQVIGRSDKYVSSPVHSPVTGKVKKIDSFLHPMGSKVTMIQIQRTGEDEWDLLDHPDRWEDASVDELRQLIWDAGIVGLGGAAFPTHVKLAPPEEKPVDSFILNGCECEPYLTSDHRAMVEMTDKILTGMSIIMKTLGVENGYIGIEDNKPDAVEAMNDRVRDLGMDYTVMALETKYPQGAEKMLIKSVLDRKVPAGGLPMDVGTVVNNVGTAIAVAEAFTEGKPLVQRVVTITGDGIAEPKNVMARIGTPFQSLIDFAGGLKEEATQVFMGGPMMGMAQHDLSIPVIKATSGIICSREATITKMNTYPCIQCGACVDACPMNLVPTRLAKFSEQKMIEAMEQYDIDSCVECGSCAFACPSHIPLVQWIRVGKYRVNESRDKQAA
ncbi:MAG: electron transport complex subunit RsxC [Candidatus Marinimicrobia bacterium]|nr:electron transport complex subunit RsxC [Candidatus Neomarinimicrobiota bacterium]MCF7827340.1 electron transport complex subunit RsxC [Candidatus Neomarinimicrobiota bacterium]MCF7881427.1 electron transport complex subunit RsxC [Candidatus Neomarinimicrobiota bacterium]